jgi:uncharacterized membrane protein HdeD (DUF308 family)
VSVPVAKSASPIHRLALRPTAQGKRGWLRNVVVSAIDLVAATLLAMFYPGNSASLISIAGATGVLMVAYVIPIVNHFVLLANK